MSNVVNDSPRKMGFLHGGCSAQNLLCPNEARKKFVCTELFL